MVMTDSVNNKKTNGRTKSTRRQKRYDEAEVTDRIEKLEEAKKRSRRKISYKYKPEFAEKLIEHMGQGLSYESFAGKCRVSRKTLYNCEKEHEEFATAKELGKEANRAYWEEVGMAGMTGEFEKFNSAIWIFNMKNRFGWTDRRETKTEHVVTLESMVDNSFKEIETTAKKVDKPDELEYDEHDKDVID